MGAADQTMEIIVEHVRSFATKQSIPIRPLTLLVGENSSGKSTFLAVVSSIFDRLRFPSNPGFNIPPYSLGNFDTIATYKAGRYGRDTDFSIGYSWGDEASPQFRHSLATYENDYGKVVLTRFRSSDPEGSIKVNVNGSTYSVMITPPSSDAKRFKSIELEGEFPDTPPKGQPLLGDMFDEFVSRLPKTPERPEKIKLLMKFLWARSTERLPYNHCFSFAPIRSKPRRTYDEFSEEYSPEGDHVPTLLARLLKHEGKSPDAKRLRDALTRFGKESGLFKKVDVKQLGKQASDPFQLQVSVAGPPANLIDVGYGVSQALPILVESVLRSASQILLLQQPEVHLHPRAQAALGSFFAELTPDGERMILVETHSDHLVDRVRQEVASGNLSPEDVMILFFHKPKLETTVSPITIDANGNVENAPPEYRSFFLEEELNLLSRSSS